MEDLPVKGSHFCMDCLDELSFTTHFEIPENDFVEKFYGRIPIVFGAALINYYSGHRVREMLHALKYKRQKVVGIQLGLLLAKELKKCAFFERPDFVIPVPLHSKKKSKRGYNQAEVIAGAISQELNIPLRKNILYKHKGGISQTKKSRIQRATNLQESIRYKLARGLEYKHVLIVDDVITTGATLEACALKLSEIEGLRFSFVTLAISKTN